MGGVVYEKGNPIKTQDFWEMNTLTAEEWERKLRESFKKMPSLTIIYGPNGEIISWGI